MKTEIIEAIQQERDFQDLKHGTGHHNRATWTMLIEAELQEAKQAVIKGGLGRNSWANEVIQVAALCVAALEQHGITQGTGEREL